MLDNNTSYRTTGIKVSSGLCGVGKKPTQWAKDQDEIINPRPELADLMSKLLQRAGIAVDAPINYLARSPYGDPYGVVDRSYALVRIMGRVLTKHEASAADSQAMVDAVEEVIDARVQASLAVLDEIEDGMPRQVSALHNIVGSLLELVLQSGNYGSQADVTAAIRAKYRNKHGLSQRNLDKVFGRANQTLARA
ncbi:hypothetical protein [Ferrimonas senticii]|uniref:hypothetical protein n=1 Tax=Ferrimonas senticii TaxID=394566 RepID=UPI0004892FE9|nr:hypothetical protein [Ferrimonas senticii]